MKHEEQKHALLSVSDRDGLDRLASELLRRGWRLWASRGTAKWLREHDIDTAELESLTGFAERVGGRVKTLDARIHAAILARADEDDELRDLGAPRFSLAVVNCYPFAEARARGDSDLAEQIDIGGPAMLRAAAKNHLLCAPVPSPLFYDEVIAALGDNDGAVPAALARRLAAATFAFSANYDAAIADWFAAGTKEETKFGTEDAAPFAGMNALEGHELRYGENPHQRGWLYRGSGAGGVAGAKLVQGAAMSYNNYADLDAAWRLVRGFAEPAAVVVKHATPCAVCAAESLPAAIAGAFGAGDESVFGGVVACNRPLDADAVEAFGDIFLELVAAPEADVEARDVFAKRRPRLRVLEVAGAGGGLQHKTIDGGVLAQGDIFGEASVESAVGTAVGTSAVSDEGWRCVTARAPSDDDRALMLFAWRVAAAVLSNAVVAARRGGDGSLVTLAIAGGRTSRLDAARAVAERVGGERGWVAASDGFFPFADGLEVLARAGAGVVVQPGGSRGDGEVVAAADALDVAMVFTGQRVFRH